MNRKKCYKKPILREHGDLKTITKANEVGQDDALGEVGGNVVS